MIRPVRRLVSVTALALGLVALAAPATAVADHITRLHLTGTIDQVNAAYIQEGIKSAAEGGAAAVLIVIDSPGGDLKSEGDIVRVILASDVPVITWVAPEGGRAGSAATFVTLAGDVAAMAPNTNIGAASVVGGSGEDLPDTLARKVTNDSVAQIRQLADRQARNADWAESAVREAASIGAAAAAAMQPPVVDFVAADEQELLTERRASHKLDEAAGSLRDRGRSGHRRAARDRLVGDDRRSGRADGDRARQQSHRDQSLAEAIRLGDRREVHAHGMPFDIVVVELNGDRHRGAPQVSFHVRLLGGRDTN